MEVALPNAAYLASQTITLVVETSFVDKHQTHDNIPHQYVALHLNTLSEFWEPPLSLVKIPNEAFDIMNSENIKALGIKQNFHQLTFKMRKKMSDLQWLDDIDRDFLDKQYQMCIPAYGGQKYDPIYNIDRTCKMRILRYYFSEDKRILASLIGEYTGCNEQCSNCGDALSVSIPIRKLDQLGNLESAKSEFVNVLCKSGSVIKNNVVSY